MIKFADGPAAAATALLVRRVPHFLRVVQDWNGEWDALDQFADAPKETEAVHVYRLLRVDGHVCLRPGGCFAMATYEHVADPPDDEVLRDNDQWRRWCAERYVAEHRDGRRLGEGMA